MITDIIDFLVDAYNALGSLTNFRNVKVPLMLCKSAAFAVKTIEFCVFEAKFWCKRAEYGASESPECEFRSEVSEQYLYTVIPP